MDSAKLRADQARSNYYIGANDSSVTAWSTKRIPFMPTGWLLVLQKQLKSTILELSPVDEKVLYAAYRSARSLTRENADLENLLIYNILGETLNAVSRHGLIFERFYEAPRDCPVQLCSPALHQYEYCLVDDKPSTLEKQEERLLATLSFRLTASALGSCASVWYAAKMGEVTLTRRNHQDKPWGISITIEAPSSLPITCSKIVKHLMDGIASALHCHDSSDIDYLSEQLGKSPGLCDEASARSLLLDSSHALFGATNLLYRYRESSGVKWNPKDEYCTYCSMRCRYGQTEQGLKIAARIFDVT
jgi:hypothetical protein